MSEIPSIKEDPSDYAKSMTDFAKDSAEHMSAYAEIAKRVQMETVELILAAGKEMSADATGAMQKVASEAATAAKKAADEVGEASRKATMSSSK